MTAQSRTSALTAAIDDLDWLTTIPHRLGDVVGIYAETIAAQPMRFRHGASLDDMLDVLRSGGTSPGRSKGDHADPSSEGHLEWLIRVQLGESASWLRQKAEAIWVASKGERFQVAEQKPLPVCWVCGPWHVHDKSRPKAHPDGGGRCVECANFHSNHGVERTEAIWKRAQYGKGPTPAQMIEARAAGKSKKRKVRAG